MDRFELFNRWHSCALLIGTRAAGASQRLQPDTITGSHEKIQAPNASNWIERQELQGGMLRWLEKMNGTGSDVMEAMHEAIARATNREIQQLLGCIERAEWLLKVKWEDGRHRNLKATEADKYGREAQERTLVMRYRGVHTRDAAADAEMTEGAMRWLRRKHGLTITGERMYDCTVEPGDHCTVCGDINTYGDYDDQEAA